MAGKGNGHGVGAAKAAFAQVATIPRTAQRCEAEGLGLSARQLRALCKSGRLKHTMMGRKALIYWPNLLQMLESGGGGAGRPHRVGG